MNLRDVGDLRRRDHVRHGVERFETLVDGDFEDGGRRIEAAVDGGDAFAVPATGVQERSFAAVPCPRMFQLIEAPDEKPAAVAKRGRKQRHV